VRFKIASQARSHGVSKIRIIHTLANLDAMDDSSEPGKLVFFGPDSAGTLLRMVGHRAAEGPDLIIVINAMPAEWTKGRKW
jgi:hypothetical protein